MNKKHWSVLGLALGVLVLGMLVGLMTVGTVAADPTPGVKIQLPRIDVGDVLGTGPWETWIQVQNVSIDDTDTGAIFLGWGEYSGLCPTNDPGVIAHYCQLIKGNALWTLRTQLATDTIKSGIIYTVSADVFQEACLASALTEGDKIAWACWVEEWEHGTCEDDGGGWADPPGAQGEEIAVTATRYGPNDYGTFVSSTYTGISEEMEGVDHPYEYYAPYVMKGYNGLDTELTIQNSGQLCTSVWIDYMEQGSCRVLYKYHVEQLAPGEAIRLKVPCNVGQIPCGWLGSAHISAEQPLGIIVDETSFDEPCPNRDRGTLLTHRARPKVEYRDRDGEPIEIKDTKVYADLLFREWSGWDASIQVQNLSRTGQNTFVTVDFMDNSGDEILFLADWVCPGGSETFYLPVVTDLGYDYVGAAEIQSHAQVSPPGGETPAAPIFAVVDLKRPDNPLTPGVDAQGGSYNAHPYSQKEWVSQIALPFVAKDATDMYTPWTSMIAIRNNSNCNKIKPEIHFKDETGTVVCEIPSFWLRPKQVKLFDLDHIGCLYPGYIGAAKVYVEEFEQLCDLDSDGHVDNRPLMPSVIVVLKGLYGSGIEGGDITSIYEGIPYARDIRACDADVLGKVHNYDAGDDLSHEDDTAPLNNVTVSVTTTVASTIIAETTNSTGDYEVEEVSITDEHHTATVTFSLAEYLTGTLTIGEDPNPLTCGEDEVLDCELLCMVNITGTVEVSDEDSGDLGELGSATVDYSISLADLDAACGYSTTYNGLYADTTTSKPATGLFTMTVPLLDRTLTYTVTKSGAVETRVFTITIMDDTAGGTMGSAIPRPWTYDDVPAFATAPFSDTDCAWNPNAVRTRGITGTVTCAYGAVVGRVCTDVDGGGCNTANDIPWNDMLVTATRIVDGAVFTDTTDVNGNYIIQVPTGVAPKYQGGPFEANGHEFDITVGATTNPVTFYNCGESIRQDFPL